MDSFILSGIANEGDESFLEGCKAYVSGCNKDAITAFEKSTAVNPGNAKAYNNLGCAYFKSVGKESPLLGGDIDKYLDGLEKAMEYFDKALDIAPDYEDAKQNFNFCKRKHEFAIALRRTKATP